MKEKILWVWFLIAGSQANSLYLFYNSVLVGDRVRIFLSAFLLLINPLIFVYYLYRKQLELEKKECQK